MRQGGKGRKGVICWARGVTAWITRRRALVGWVKGLSGLRGGLAIIGVKKVLRHAALFNEVEEIVPVDCVGRKKDVVGVRITADSDFLALKSKLVGRLHRLTFLVKYINFNVK